MLSEFHLNAHRRECQNELNFFTRDIKICYDGIAYPVACFTRNSAGNSWHVHNDTPAAVASSQLLADRFQVGKGASI